MPIRMELELFADYHQIYLQDENSTSSLEDAWSDDATQRMVAVADGVIGIGTARATTVPVSVEVFETPPPLDHSCSLAVEADISVPSGVVVIAGCTDYFPEAKRINIMRGRYRVRATFNGLDTVTADELDGNDRYEIALWPELSVRPVQVVIDNRDSKNVSGSNNS